MFYDPQFQSTQLVIRYAIGQQEREAVVLAKGHTLEHHVGRLESLIESAVFRKSGAATYLTWPLATGGAVAIRIVSIIAIEG